VVDRIGVNVENRTCSVDGCDKPVKARHMCPMHYSRWRLSNGVAPMCSVQGCGRPVVGRGWCSMHWQRWKAHGDPGEAESRCMFNKVQKRCAACGEIKRLAEFYMTVNKNRMHLGPRPMSRCKVCVIASAQDWQARNPERAAEVDAAYKARNRRKIKLTMYKLTEDELSALEAEQAGRCRICGTEVGHALVIDHCHEAGYVRGLLCGQCNLGLGAFRDDPARLTAAIAYLEEARTRRVGRPTCT
jgi:hypothetical protein